MKAINVIKRPGYIKIVKYCGRLSFLPLNPSVRFGVISSFLFFFTYSINGYWVSDLFQASQLMKEQQIIVNKKWFFMQLDISSLGESDLILGSFWPPMQIQRAVSSSCLPIWVIALFPSLVLLEFGGWFCTHSLPSIYNSTPLIPRRLSPTITFPTSALPSQAIWKSDITRFLWLSVSLPFWDFEIDFAIGTSQCKVHAGFNFNYFMTVLGPLLYIEE